MHALSQALPGRRACETPTGKACANHHTCTCEGRILAVLLFGFTSGTRNRCAQVLAVIQCSVACLVSFDFKGNEADHARDGNRNRRCLIAW